MYNKKINKNNYDYNIEILIVLLKKLKFRRLIIKTNKFVYF